MCSLYDRIARNILAPGAIFQLYEKYMTPCAFNVEEISPDELERSALETTSRRLMAAVLEDFAFIAMRGDPVLSPLLSFLGADILYDAVCRMAADLLEITTNAALTTESSIFDVPRIDGPIPELAKIELIFVNGVGEIRRPRRYIIYAASRYYSAQYALGERLLSVA